MKKSIICPALLLIAVFLAGCKSKYVIINEAASKIPAAQYKNIYVG